MTRDRAVAEKKVAEISNPTKPSPIVQAKTTTPAGSTGILTIESIPTGAKVLLNGTHAGETPLRLEGLPEGRHTVTLVTDSVTVKRTVRVEAGKTVILDVPVFSGWVAIFAPIVLEVSEGNKGLGSTDQGRILLAPGRHVLTVTNRSLGYSSTHTIEVGAGEETPLNLTPTGTVNLNAVPWAEVWVDGTPCRRDPAGQPRGTARHARVRFQAPAAWRTARHHHHHRCTGGGHRRLHEAGFSELTLHLPLQQNRNRAHGVGTPVDA